jgi:hypothetical protein
MSRFKVLIPTRDSARWIGIFLDAYRKAGIEPSYVLDPRSADSTLDILRRQQADFILFAPFDDFVEAGMLEFGARHAGADWLLRVDDDEFPSRALLGWISSVGARSLNQAWYISRRSLFVRDAAIVYSRGPGNFAHPQASAFLQPQLRLFHAKRVAYLNKVHTSGLQKPVYASFAPQDAFLIHCNCLLRTPSERWSKIQKYEAIEALSTLRFADEYLPELFSLEHHNARRDGLDEFAELFESLPIHWSAAPLVLDRQTRDLLESEVSRYHERIVAWRNLRPVTSADDFAWLHSVPRLFWRPAASFLSAFGRGRIHAAGVAIRNYQTFFAPIELDDVIYFSDRLSVSKVMREGWSEPEQTGVWSENGCSAIALQLAKSLSVFRMIFDLRPFADHGNSQAATVTVNNREFDRWLFETGERRLVVVNVNLPSPEDRISIRILHRHPISPHDLGAGDDKRKLGIFLHSLQIAAQP